MQLLTREFDRDSTRAYTPMEGVVEKLMQHAQSPEYWKRVKELQARHVENYRNARALMSRNRVTYLDRLATAETKAVQQTR